MAACALAAGLHPVSTCVHGRLSNATYVTVIVLSSNVGTHCMFP